MKNFLMLIIIIAVIVASGSVFYYYVIYIPKQDSKSEEDINAIRNVLAPTPEQQKLQQQQSAQREAQFEKALNDYYACEKNNAPKRNAYIKNQCSYLSSTDPLYYQKYKDCSSKASTSTGYRKLDCKSPF